MPSQKPFFRVALLQTCDEGFRQTKEWKKEPDCHRTYQDSSEDAEKNICHFKIPLNLVLQDKSQFQILSSHNLTKGNPNHMQNLDIHRRHRHLPGYNFSNNL